MDYVMQISINNNQSPYFPNIPGKPPGVFSPISEASRRYKDVPLPLQRSGYTQASNCQVRQNCKEVNILDIVLVLLSFHDRFML